MARCWVNGTWQPGKACDSPPDKVSVLGKDAHAESAHEQPPGAGAELSSGHFAMDQIKWDISGSTWGQRQGS